MHGRDNQAIKRGWTPDWRVAPALLWLFAMIAGCLNPTLHGTVDVEVNHAPTLDDVTPPLDFNPLVVNFGTNCREESFRAVVDDPDGDILTVRFNIIVPRGNPPTGARVLLLERQLTPVADPPPGASAYALPPFALAEDLLARQLGDFEAQAGDTTNFQLLELRVSDGDFVAGSEEVPGGRAQVVATWAIDLTRVAPPGCGGGE